MTNRTMTDGIIDPTTGRRAYGARARTIRAAQRQAQAEAAGTARKVLSTAEQQDQANASIEAFFAETNQARPPRPYTAGAQAVDVVGSKVKLSRYVTQHAQWQPVSQLCDEIIAQVRAEDRRVLRVKVGDLHVDPSGVVGRKGKPGMLLEPGATSQLFAACGGFQGRQYWKPQQTRTTAHDWCATLPGEERAHMWEYALKTGRIATDTEIQVIVRRIAGQWQVMAILSGTYSIRSIDQVLEDIKPTLSQLGDECRGYATYEGATADLRLSGFWQSESLRSTRDYHRRGFEIGANDMGQGGIIVNAKVVREACMNMAMPRTRSKSIASIAHRGDLTDAGQRLREAIAKAQEVCAPYLQAIEVFNATPVLDALEAIRVDREAVTTRVEEGVPAPLAVLAEIAADRRILSIPGHDERERFTLLEAAWKAEPGETLGHTFQAITRLHEASTLPAHLQESVAHQAGGHAREWARTLRALA